MCGDRCGRPAVGWPSASGVRSGPSDVGGGFCQQQYPPTYSGADREGFGVIEGLRHVRCGVCPHECDIPEDGEGLYKARGVRDGKLVELVYGRPATIISDEVEKKPLFHFHPGKRALSLGTLGCNVLCSGCQNWQISHASARGEAKKLSYLSPDHAVSMARKHKLNGVVWTYNDPVVWIDYVTYVPVRDTVCPACDRTLVHRGSGRAEKVWTRGGKCSFCGEELHMVGDDMGSGDAER